MDFNKKYQPNQKVHIIKKDGSKVPFKVEKVLNAVSKSAKRVMIDFTQEEKERICRLVVEKVNETIEKGTDISFSKTGVAELPILTMHSVVEYALENTKPIVAKSYRDYRNYKQDFVQMLDEVYKKSMAVMYIGDKENANTDSALVSTRRSLVFNQLNKAMYQKFFSLRVFWWFFLCLSVRSEASLRRSAGPLGCKCDGTDDGSGGGGAHRFGAGAAASAEQSGDRAGARSCRRGGAFSCRTAGTLGDHGIF